MRTAEGRSRSPRRRSDRVADLAAWAVSAGALLVLLASLLVGIGSFGALTQRAAVEARDRTPTSAVVLEDVPLVPAAGALAVAPVRWTDPDGVERTGSAEVTAPLTAGDQVRIWVGTDHRPVRAPITRLAAGMAASTVTVLVLAVGVLLVLLFGRLAFARVGRMRGAEWEREWEEVEPTWTRR